MIGKRPEVGTVHPCIYTKKVSAGQKKIEIDGIIDTEIGWEDRETEIQMGPQNGEQRQRDKEVGW